MGPKLTRFSKMLANARKYHFNEGTWAVPQILRLLILYTGEEVLLGEAYSKTANGESL